MPVVEERLEADLLMAECAPKVVFLEALEFEKEGDALVRGDLTCCQRWNIRHRLVSDLIRRAHFQNGEGGVRRLYQLCPWFVNTISDWRAAVPDPEWNSPVILPESLVWKNVSPYDLI